MTFIKDFDGWNEYKKNLNKQTPHVYNSKLRTYVYGIREIWFCSIGVNVGSEICGKNADYERPVLIMRKYGEKFVCLPLTSKKPKNKKIYEELTHTFNDGTKLISYVLIGQPLTLDVRRLQRRVKKLPPDLYNNINKRFKDSI